MKVFVCYEAYNHALAVECGAVNQLTVFGNEVQAIDWMYDRLHIGKEDGFVIDSECEMLNDGGDIDEVLLLGEIENKFASVTMFSGYQENWDESFDIAIEVKEVK